MEENTERDEVYEQFMQDLQAKKKRRVKNTQEKQELQEKSHYKIEPDRVLLINILSGFLVSIRIKAA